MNSLPDFASASNSPEAGQSVGRGRYLLKKPLGEGGMGVVWLAHDKLLREPVALKFLPNQVSFDPAALEALRRETLRARKLSHPNIIRIHDLNDVSEEHLFLSMEYVNGANLHTLRAKKSTQVLAWNFLEPLVLQLCSALAYAHGERLIHRDLKPANLMLDQTGRLKLADFGLARVASDSMSRLSTTGETSGTLSYMSPQQADGRRPRVTDDIYSLGVTLYELLTSTPPFHSGDIGYQLRHTRPDPPAHRLAELGLTNDIPAHVSAMIMACLAKEADQRPKDISAIQKWLESGLAGGATVTRDEQETSQRPQPVAVASPQALTLTVECASDLEEVSLPSTATTAEALPAVNAVAQYEPGNGSFGRKLRYALALLTLIAAGSLGWMYYGADVQPATDEDGFMSLFNGTDLSGWSGDTSFWHVKDGAITAFTAEEGIARRHNTCLIWNGTVTNFELRLSFKLTDVISAKPANSGILFRSRNIGNWEVKGYQCDLHGKYTGTFLLLEKRADQRTRWGYESALSAVRGQTTIRPTGKRTTEAELAEVVRDQDWNELTIIAHGDRVTHKINGVTTSDIYVGDIPERSRSGLLALELKRATALYFKDIRLKHIPPETEHKFTDGPKDEVTLSTGS